MIETLIVVAQLSTIDCREHYPGPERERWTWRTIDGKRCWYKGRKLPKDRLRWPDPPTPPFNWARDEPDDPPAETELPKTDSFKARWPQY
jgi:hypothetical protein